MRPSARLLIMIDMVGDDVEAGPLTSRPSTDRGDEARGESAQVAKREPYRRAATGTGDATNPVTADDSDLDDRKTQKFSAGHFQALIGTMDTPPIEIAPPVVCEEVASGSLIAEAIAQIKAGARVTLDTAESVPMRVVEEAAELSVAPTVPENPLIAEIATSRTRSRHAVKMSRITKPPPIARQPTAPIEIPESLEVMAQPAVMRAMSEPDTVAPVRSRWGMVFGSMLVLALMATIVILLQAR